MSDDQEIDLAKLPDDELVKQMHDDLYDGLAEEIVEGTTILLDRSWSADRVLNDALVEGNVRVVSPQAGQFAGLLRAQGATVVETENGLVISEMEAPQIGELAASKGVVLHELAPQRASLEEAFIELTRDSVQYHAGSEVPLATAAAGGTPS